MIKQALYLLASFYVFNSLFKLSDESRDFILGIVDFINLLSAFLNIRNFVSNSYAKFDKGKFLYVASIYLIGSIIYRRIIMKHELNPVSWIITLKPHIIIVVMLLIIPNISPLTQKVIFTIAGFSSTISYYEMLKDVTSLPPVHKLIPLIIHLNLSSYFSKSTVWLCDFLLFGKIYLMDYMWHFLLNLTLLICAIINNNIYTVRGNHHDFLWYYLVVFFLFLNNHGYLIFRKKYKVVRETDAMKQKAIESANLEKKMARRHRMEQKNKTK